MLTLPELYDIAEDPGENYDIAALYPEVVRDLQQKIEQQIPTFPAKVIQAYSDLKHSPDSPTTPAGAASRPASYVPGRYHYDGHPN